MYGHAANASASIRHENSICVSLARSAVFFCCSLSPPLWPCLEPSGPHLAQAYNYGQAVTGWDITADDQLVYNKWIADQVGETTFVPGHALSLVPARERVMGMPAPRSFTTRTRSGPAATTRQQSPLSTFHNIIVGRGAVLVAILFFPRGGVELFLSCQKLSTHY